MFDAGNGYSKDGAHYSEGFRKSFFKAPATRNAALIADAQKQWEKLQADAGEKGSDLPSMAHRRAVLGLSTLTATLLRSSCGGTRASSVLEMRAMGIRSLYYSTT